MTTIFMAELETHNFTFQALGDSVESARGALISGLIEHARQYRLAQSWWSDYSEDIAVFPFVLNVSARRDGEIFHPAERRQTAD
jgi:hypothetical protein